MKFWNTSMLWWRRFASWPSKRDDGGRTRSEIVIYDKSSLLDAPKQCIGLLQNPVFHAPFWASLFLCHKIQRVIQARAFAQIYDDCG